ncbi:MAG: hypothetical protein EBT80_00395 [Chitinophagales bacterium]|nr:hypothetical protein [Chitinophagales bacterium]
MPEPRFRRSDPVEMDLSDSEELDKFLGEAAAGSQHMFENYTSQGQRIGLESVGGVVALEIMQRVERDLVELVSRCVRFCPHVSSLPYSRPHLILPGLGVITCLDCAKDHIAAADPDDSSCDLCGVEAGTFYELNLQMGPGVLAVNLGDCCISKFKP